MNKAFLSIGTNKGSRGSNIKLILNYLLNNSIEIINKSSIYETEPLEYRNQPYFYNIVLEIEAKYKCNELFLILKNIEHNMGRNFYDSRNYPRIIDIDILTYNDQIINNDLYNIPHSRLHERRFVLIPWMEISSSFVVPKYNLKVSSLLNNTNDSSRIRKLDNKY